MKILDIISEQHKPTRTLAGFPVNPIAKINTVKEAIDDLKPQYKRLGTQDINDRVAAAVNKTNTKKDRATKPIIHASNITILNDNNQPWDLNDLARQIMIRPNAKSFIKGNSKMRKSNAELLAKNKKMQRSAITHEEIYDITLPALAGIIVDENTMEFVEVNTCPGAGPCKLFCYGRKGGYVQFPKSSMSSARYLNFLLNDPHGFSNMVDNQIKNTKKRLDKRTTKLIVRWHDTGDFFSKEYLDLAYNIAINNPDVEFYAYTKMAHAITSNTPPNWLNRFSQGATTDQTQQVQNYQKQGNTVLQSEVVPSSLFNDLVAKKNGKKVKDKLGQTQFKDQNAVNTLFQRIAQQYNINPESLITYNQIIGKPVGKEPFWNVIVPPGAGDLAAKRRDVLTTFLLFH